MNKTKNLKIKYNKYLNNFNFKNTFFPTYTTLSLTENSFKYTKKNQKILDLGCGSGIISACLYEKKLNQKFYLSDLSEKSVKVAKENLNFMNKSCEFKNGDIFKPWQNYTFDLIVNDVSGVSSTVSKISPWFKNIPIDKSIDGTFLLKKATNEASKYMNDKSIFITPIISLSKVQNSLKIIKKKLNILKIKKIEWPLPKNMIKNLPILEKLKKRKIIDYYNKFGFIICYTLIIIAKKK
jgi:SAM-dependent methyltransferase